jgi:uncharacterized membrane protein
MKSRKIFSLLFLSIILILQIPSVEANPELRSVRLSTSFPKIKIETGQKVNLEVKIINKGSTGDFFDISVSGPSEWGANLQSSGYVIQGVYLDGNESKTIKFEAIPPFGEEAGTYNFTINAISSDMVLSTSLDIQVELPQTISKSGISISTPYPSIEGPAGADYEYSVNVINRGAEDTIIDFTAVHPEGWSVTFKPRFQSSLIRSLEFEAGGNEVLVVTVSTPSNVEPGNYKLEMIAESEEHRETLGFEIFLIGTYSLDFDPSNGLLSLEAIQGKASIITLNLNNTGTTPLESITLFSDKPIGWDVQFEIPEIEFLDSAASRQIRASIHPPEDAIPGDYMVKLFSAVQAHGISKTLNYRVTVKGSVAWGFVGMAIIGIMAIVLVGVIWRLGRR